MDFEQRCRLRRKGCNAVPVNADAYLSEQQLSSRFDHRVDVGSDTRLDSAHQEQVGNSIVAIVRATGESILIDQGTEINSGELTPLKEELRLLFHFFW